MSAHSVTHSLTAELRTLAGHQVKALRRNGQVPAVVYGNIKENLSLSLNQHDFEKLFNEAGFSTLINLKVDGEKPVKVLIHDIQQEPLRGTIQHVDLFAVNMKEKLTTEVPLEFIGTADAVDLLGGIFLTVKDTLEIECLPDDLPQSIQVDISSLKTFEDSIRVKDLVLPEGVTTDSDLEDTIASVSEPISEEELAALDEAPTAEVETEFDTTSGTEADAPDAEGKGTKDAE